MKSALWLGQFTLIAILVGCGQPELSVTPAGGIQPLTTESRPAADEHAQVQLLRDKANALAKAEISRMGAAALIYRNLPEFHALKGELFAPGYGAYVKMFRKYTDFEVLDIRRAESILHPIEIDIKFYYEIFATPERISLDENALQKCRADKEFSLLASYDLDRSYQCDEQGNVNGALPDIPERPSYWDRGRKQAGLLSKTSTEKSVPESIFTNSVGVAPGAPAGAPAQLPPELRGKPGTENLVPLTDFDNIIPGQAQNPPKTSP